MHPKAAAAAEGRGGEGSGAHANRPSGGDPRGRKRERANRRGLAPRSRVRDRRDRERREREAERERWRERAYFIVSLPPSPPSVPRNSRTFTSPLARSRSRRKSHFERAAAPPIAVERSAEGAGGAGDSGHRGHAPRATAAHSVARLSGGGRASERERAREQGSWPVALARHRLLCRRRRPRLRGQLGKVAPTAGKAAAAAREGYRARTMLPRSGVSGGGGGGRGGGGGEGVDGRMESRGLAPESVALFAFYERSRPSHSLISLSPSRDNIDILHLRSSEQC